MSSSSIKTGNRLIVHLPCARFTLRDKTSTLKGPGRGAATRTKPLTLPPGAPAMVAE
jgi:hypothetical protein